MDKLLDTLTNSCEGLKKKGVITPEEYEKCKAVGHDEHRDEYSANENKDYINKVFGSKRNSNFTTFQKKAKRIRKYTYLLLQLQVLHGH